MTQASVPGWAGHQVAPLSVASTSITTKNTVTATPVATRCLLNHAKTGFTESRYDSFGPAEPAAEPSGGQDPTKVACRAPGSAVRRVRTRPAGLPGEGRRVVKWTACKPHRAPHRHPGSSSARSGPAGT